MTQAKPSLRSGTVPASGRTAGVAAVLTANLLWSGGFSATAIALPELSPTLLALVRLLFGSMTLLPFLWLGGRAVWTKSTLWLALWLGWVGFTAPMWLEIKGLSLSTPALAAVFIAVEPILTVVVSAVLLGERLSPLRWVAVVVAFIGAWAIAGFPRPGRAGYLAGELLLFASVICYAFYNAYSNRLTVRLGSPAAATAATFISGFLGTLPLWLWEGTYLPTHLSWRIAVAVGYLCVASTSAAYWLWMVAVHRIPVSIAALFLNIQPVLGVLLAVWIVGTRLSLDFYIGAALVGGALLLGRLSGWSTPMAVPYAGAANDAGVEESS